jgi:hypothetical protein
MVTVLTMGSSYGPHGWYAVRWWTLFLPDSVFDLLRRLNRQPKPVNRTPFDSRGEMGQQPDMFDYRNS